MHTDGGAVIRKPGSAWFKGTHATIIILMFCFMKYDPKRQEKSFYTSD